MKLNILVAYPYINKMMIETVVEHRDSIRWLVDSGAFTAWKAGKEVSIDAYCKFIEGLPITPWRYFTLDVIGNPKASMANYEVMLKRGFNPIPIFTRGEDPSALDEYYKTSDVVGIGGLVGTRGNKSFINGIMKHVGNRKVHWLGFTSIEFIKHYKPYMCDCSSWDIARFKNVSLYLGNGKRTGSKLKMDLLRERAPWFLRYIGEMGMNLSDLLEPDRKKRNGGWSRLSAASWVQMSLDIEEHVGTKLFLATTDARSVQMLVSTFNHFKGGEGSALSAE